jgi:hypothetical protein
MKKLVRRAEWVDSIEVGEKALVEACEVADLGG